MNQSQKRRVFQGISASPGIAVGLAMVMTDRNLVIPHHHILSDETSYETRRLRKAIEASRNELGQIKKRLGTNAPADYRLILDAHLMMHSDELLIDGAIQEIIDRGVNAEWAIESLIKKIKHHLEQASDDYFRDRAVEIEHVGSRILAQLTGRSSSLPSKAKGRILVVSDLHPAEAIQLVELQVKALITELGSATSHTAILTRALEIPSVMGLTGVFDQIGSGDLIIVDALKGEITLGADQAEIDLINGKAKRYRQFTTRLRQNKDVKLETRDGEYIELLANIELPAEAAIVVEEQAEGIGLYRTDFLFMNRRELPSEEDQVKIYSDITKVMNPRPVVFRTLDAGDESLVKTTGYQSISDPVLGLRALRLALLYPDILLTQLRAVLRAAVHGPVSIMFPFICGIDEVRRAKSALQQASAELEQLGMPYGSVNIGFMIELPSAVIMSDHIARECSFLSVGTNDLVQYTMAVGRTDPRVAYLADAMDPAILRLLQMVSQSARNNQTKLSMCGGMAADAIALPLVIGLDFRSLSVPVGSLPLIREVLRCIDFREARSITQQALNASTASEVREMVMHHFHGCLADVWVEAGIEIG